MARHRPALRSRASLLPLAGATVLVTALFGTSASSQQVYLAQGSSGPRAALAGNEFGIRVGSVVGLRPGGDITVPVRYTNPFPHGLTVKSQDIQVTSPVRACPAEMYVDLTRARTVLAQPVVLPAGKARTVDIVLSLRATAPDRCQGVPFVTTIRAQGRKA